MSAEFHVPDQVIENTLPSELCSTLIVKPIQSTAENPCLTYRHIQPLFIRLYRCKFWEGASSQIFSQREKGGTHESSIVSKTIYLNTLHISFLTVPPIFFLSLCPCKNASVTTTTTATGTTVPPPPPPVQQLVPFSLFSCVYQTKLKVPWVTVQWRRWPWHSQDTLHGSCWWAVSPFQLRCLRRASESAGPLQAITALGLLADHIEHRVDQFSTLGVVTFGPVFTGSALTYTNQTHFI